MEKRDKLFIGGLIAAGLTYAVSNHPSWDYLSKRTLSELDQTTRQVIQDERHAQNREFESKNMDLRRTLQKINPQYQEEKPIESNDLTQSLIRYEGIREKAYTDTKGNMTIGVGFNLERNDARQRINDLGLDFNDVYNKKQKLSREQILTLLEEDISTAQKDASKYLGKETFNSLDKEAQKIVTDMSFNLGFSRLSGFKKLRKALINKDYCTAAYEMVDSKWYGDVGRRSRELVSKMRSLGDCRE
jgi:GH24 family phage-related lysozyme (muramidase)